MKRKKYDYTDEDIRIAEENGINVRAFRQRLARGMSVEEARTAPLVTRKSYDRDLVRKAEENGIPSYVFYERKRAGWSDERASTAPVIRKPRHGTPRNERRRHPVGWTPDDPLEDWEIVAIVARIKYMNLTETKDYPITVPKPIMERLAQMGLSYENIMPMEVDDDGETA